MKLETLSGTSVLKGPEMVSVLQELSGLVQGEPVKLLSGGVSQTRSPSVVQSLLMQFVP
jgi:hypothetical protein